MTAEQQTFIYVSGYILVALAGAFLMWVRWTDKRHARKMAEQGRKQT